MLPEDLPGRHARREKFQHVGHSNPHTANARAAATLPGIYRDSIHQLCHAHFLPQVALVAERQGSPAAMKRTGIVVRRRALVASEIMTLFVQRR